MVDDQIGAEPIDPTPAPRKSRSRINRKIHDKPEQKQPRAKSHLKLVEEAREEAAPAANILGTPATGPDPYDLARKMHRLGRISYNVLIFHGIKFTTQIGAVFAEPTGQLNRP
jgi:hypothetical protein